MLNLDEITIVYQQVASAKEALHDIGEMVINAEMALEAAKAVAISTGEINGKNQAQRDANIAIMFADQIAELERLQKDHRQAKLDHELALLELSRIKMLMRLAELTQVQS